MTQSAEESRACARLSPELHDRLRRVCYWDRHTVQDWLVAAIQQAVEQAETRRGALYPPLPDGMRELPKGQYRRQ